MIHVQDLIYRYPDKKEPTIQGINVQIGTGEIFGFLGPSGAGKSTLQKILIGVLKGYEGKVNVLGQEVKKSGSTFYEKIGVAFEFPNFYNKFSAIENLSFFASLYASDTENPMDLLTVVGLEQHAHVKVAHFSKGMKMRLNLCRALINKPELLFLDEPTSGLDPRNAQLVKELITEQTKKGKTVIITTHNMHIAEEICDRVAFIVDGKVSVIDSPRELKLSRGEKAVRVEYRRWNGLKTKEFRLDGIGRNEAFWRLLREEQVETIHTQETTLEQVFIDVTGRLLR